MSFELSFQASFDASFRRSFELSDVRSDVLSFVSSDAKSDARSDVTSIEMSNGRSVEVGLRTSVLRYFPVNFEASFLTSFQTRLLARIRLGVEERDRGIERSRDRGAHCGGREALEPMSERSRLAEARRTRHE
jgi:hypothetical protein